MPHHGGADKSAPTGEQDFHANEVSANVERRYNASYTSARQDPAGLMIDCQVWIFPSRSWSLRKNCGRRVKNSCRFQSWRHGGSHQSALFEFVQRTVEARFHGLVRFGPIEKGM